MEQQEGHLKTMPNVDHHPGFQRSLEVEIQPSDDFHGLPNFTLNSKVTLPCLVAMEH